MSISLESAHAKIQRDLAVLREAGQKEYAHEEDNAFANFERAGQALGVPREVVLKIFALKHVDGVKAWAGGHKSQREDVTGRLNDIMVYMVLLDAMACEGLRTRSDIAEHLDYMLTEVGLDLEWELVSLASDVALLRDRVVSGTPYEAFTIAYAMRLRIELARSEVSE